MRWLVGIVVGVYLAVLLLLQIPAVQRGVSSAVAKGLSNKLQTEVRIGHIDIGLFNRLIITDLHLKDRTGTPMLKVGRASVKIEWLPLFRGKVIISTAQLFDFNAELYQNTENERPNYQFVLDAFASKDTTNRSPLDLRINTLLIRRGAFSFDKRYKEETPRKFNLNHLKVKDLSANVVLKVLRQDSLNVKIKKLGFEEQSGLTVNSFTFYVLANEREATLSSFNLKMPGTEVAIDTLRAQYRLHERPFQNSLVWSGRLLPSCITPADISCFAPKLVGFTAPVCLSARLKGTHKQLDIRDLELSSENRDVLLAANVKLTDYWGTQGTRPFLSARINHLDVSGTGWRFLFRNLRPHNPEVPPMLARLGNIHYQGEAEATKEAIALLGHLSTGLGSVDTDLEARRDSTFRATISAHHFQIGDLLNNEKLGNISLSVQATGHYNKRNSTVLARGLVGSIDYSGYTYQNVQLDGTYSAGSLNGNFSLDDPNGLLQAKGKADFSKQVPVFNLEAQLAHFRPHTLNLTTRYPNTEFNAHLNANFSGNSIDNMDGEISLNHFEMQSPDSHFRTDSLSLSAHKNSEGRTLQLNSDFMTAHVQGDFNYGAASKSVAHLLHSYLPSVIGKPQQKSVRYNAFNFDVEVRNADALQKFLNVPLLLHEPARLQGRYDDATAGLSVKGNFPDFEFNGSRYDKGTLLCETASDSIRCTFGVNKQMANASLMLNLYASVKDDYLNTAIGWSNQRMPQNYSGTLWATTHFSRALDNKTSFNTEVIPSRVVINDTVWNVHAADIHYHDRSMEVRNFLIEHRDRHLGINGRVSKNAADSLVADLKDIDLEYVFGIVNFHAVDFAGQATGKAYASQLLTNPRADAKVNVPNFKFNDGEMGNLNAQVKWDKEDKAIVLDANMQDLENQSSTNVKGKIVIGKGLDIHINTRRANLYFLNHFTKGIFTDFQGRATGNVRIFGPFKKINLEGDAWVHEASTKVDVLNTSFKMQNDSVHMRPNIIKFDQATVYDKEGTFGQKDHCATVNGVLRHDHFSNLTYSFEMQGTNMLAYDWRDFGDDGLFYGTVYGTGRVKLQGRPGAIDIDIDARPNARTVFTYNAATPEIISDGQFVKFVPRNRPQTPQTPIEAQEQLRKEEEDKKIQSDLHINFLLDITPDATMKLIMDPAAGDYISINGSGNIRANYYNKGRMQMFGTYQIDHGIYKLSLQEVIRKDFQLKRGGTITFGGTPYQADLNMQAIYTVNSVSLNDLGAGMFSQNNVRVNCIMNLTGKASAPKVSFDFDLPNVNEDEKQMVRSLISTNEEKNMQIIYLLGIGRFYNANYASTAATDQSQSAVAMKSLLSSTLSGQLNQVLSNAIKSNNWNFGANLSTGDKGWSDMDVEGLLSGKLLNNRLLINGNFGYRESQTSTTTFVGDFDLQWLLTRNGSISLKAYNETNDRYFTKSSLTTQGIGIILKKDFDNWLDLFRFKRRLKKERAEK